MTANEFFAKASACGAGDPEQAPACGSSDPAPACGSADPANAPDCGTACGTQDK